MNKKTKALLLAVEKGYKVCSKGILYNPKGKVLKGKIVKKRPTQKGYKSLSIRVDGKPVSIGLHRIVAYQKYGDLLFKEGVVVRHLNDDSFDNSFDNIEIGTAYDNIQDRIKNTGYNIPKEKVKNNRIPQKDKIYQWLYEGKSYDWIIENSDVTSKGTLSYMKNKSIEYKEYIKNLA